jgi:DNA polymerase delta subunit 1
MKRDRDDDEEEEEDYGVDDSESHEEEMDISKDVLHEVSSEGYRSLMETWRRDPPPAIDPDAPILFQQIEVDCSMQPSSSAFPCREEKEAVIRMFGCTRGGHSVTAFVHGFQNYFYARAPPWFTDERIFGFFTELNAKVTKAMRGKAKYPIVNVEMVEKQDVMYYNFNKLDKFLKITVSMPSVIREAAAILEAGLQVGMGLQTFELYESKLSIELRFMVDYSIVGCSWVELAGGSWRQRPWKLNTGFEMDKLTTTQLEYDVHYDSVVAHAPEGEYMDVAPLRVLSFDIECAGRPGIFPEPEVDLVIQIANVVTLQGCTEPLIKNVFTLNTCASIPGTKVISFDSEVDLLNAWRHFFQSVDADIVSGYNIVLFDIPFLISRAETLNVGYFAFLGRVRNTPTKVVDKVMTTKQTGARASKKINIEGRVQIDLFVVIQRDYKLSSYSLNGVSAHFLKEQKEDVHHSIISDLQNGDADTRRRLAVYCVKDALLPIRLMVKLMVLVNYVEMGRVTGVPLSFLLTRGQGIRVMSQLYRRTAAHDLVIPTAKRAVEGEKFQGATVLEPLKGFYTDPVSTLDFASLYPSIMRAHNLCYTTLLRPEDVSKVPPEEITTSPTGDKFVKATQRPGLLPLILTELLTKRKAAKKLLKQEKDPFKKAVYDGRQLALKVSANSVYGFTGAQVGDLPCLAISSTVTGFGRQMIEQSKQYAEQTYCRKNGYEHDAVCVYGDTDSIFVKFGCPDMHTAIKLGQECADAITEKLFIPPIELEFEKVYLPLLLMNKKRYAGPLWTSTEKYDYLDSKGLETVRRDNANLTKQVVGTTLDMILLESNPDGAIKFVKQKIADLLQNKIDITDLIITKGLTKTADQYAGNKLGHVELAARMKKRDPGSAPNVGDRVAYVMVKGDKKQKAYELAEDPLFVLENDIPIDFQWYLDHQLAEPLKRIFEPVVPNVSASLLGGDHTRKVYKATNSAGPLMQFAQKSMQCLGCRTVIRSGALCTHCMPREVEIYMTKQHESNLTERQFASLWTTCQRCVKSLNEDVICSNNDCQIFYKRVKAMHDTNKARVTMQRFGPASW